MRMLDESGDADAKQKRRNAAFKVIPRVAEGNWMVRQAVGTTPALLGHKLVTRYFRCDRQGWQPAPLTMQATQVPTKLPDRPGSCPPFVIRASLPITSACSG